jgi:hypothetical protein
MLVGATNNETNSADLTVLDYLLPSGLAPAAVEDYECINCPAGRPLAFLVFPRTEISKVLNSRPRVKEIWPLPDGGFEVAVNEGEVGDAETANAQYSFGSDLRLRDAQITDGYVANFNKLLARGAVKHALDRKAEADHLRHIRYWDGHGFREELPGPPGHLLNTGKEGRKRRAWLKGRGKCRFRSNNDREEDGKMPKS